MRHGIPTETSSAAAVGEALWDRGMAAGLAPLDPVGEPVAPAEATVSAGSAAPSVPPVLPPAPVAESARPAETASESDNAAEPDVAEPAMRAGSASGPLVAALREADEATDEAGVLASATAADSSSTTATATATVGTAAASARRLVSATGLRRPALIGAAALGAVLIAAPAMVAMDHSTPHETDAGKAPNSVPLYPYPAGASNSASAQPLTGQPSGGASAAASAHGGGSGSVRHPSAGGATQPAGQPQGAGQGHMVSPTQVNAPGNSNPQAPTQNQTQNQAQTQTGSSGQSTPAGSGQPTSSGSFNITGQLLCESGHPVTGVWVQAANSADSRFASWMGIGNGETADWWTTLPSDESYSLHVGCGGTPSSWATSNNTPVVSGGHNSFNCDDVTGDANYEWCNRR